MIQIKTEVAWVQTMMAEMFFCGWFSWDLSLSPWSFWSEWWRFPKSDWCEVGVGQVVKRWQSGRSTKFYFPLKVTVFWIYDFLPFPKPIFSFGIHTWMMVKLFGLLIFMVLIFIVLGLLETFLEVPELGYLFEQQFVISWKNQFWGIKVLNLLEGSTKLKKKIKF